MGHAGVVLCIPYPHTDTVSDGPGLNYPSSSATPAGDSYELIAALTRVRGILFGEDFQNFLRGGATQRYSLTTYLDLFCYQPPEHRLRHLNASPLSACVLLSQLGLGVAKAGIDKHGHGSSSMPIPFACRSAWPMQHGAPKSSCTLQDRIVRVPVQIMYRLLQNR